MLFVDSGLSQRQEDLLRAVARARQTTLLRWPFYLKLGDDDSAALGHPDLYGHDIRVHRRDISRLTELGLMQRFASGEPGFIEDYDITDRGISCARRLAFRAGLRRWAWVWITAALVVSLAVAWL